MRWKGRRGSDNIDDRRSRRGPALAGGGVIGIILVVVFLLLGGDPQLLLQNQPGPQGGLRSIDPAEDETARFVAVVLADTEDVWNRLLPAQGTPYREPTLVLFRDSVSSACGMQGAATGPFYCPLDEKVYIDLSFFDELAQRYRAAGDFAQAYVIAHEVGHHVQNVLGTSDKVHNLRNRARNEEEANRLSVRLELQADFLAGVWAHHAQKQFNILEEGDVEEAMQAAAAIGDDRLQRQSRGYVAPESFTHGTSEQRARWFYRGLKTGDINQGDTFNIPYDQL